MKTLDRQRPYATVWGGTVAHRFEQDGRKFDSEGNELGAPAATEAPPATPALTGAQQAAATMLDSNAASVIAELPDVSDDLLAALRAGEIAGKTRKSLMAALDAELAKRGGALDHVDAQLGD